MSEEIFNLRESGRELKDSIRAAAMEHAMNFVGQPTEALREFLKRCPGWRMRITKVDGKPCVTTRDYNPQRINIGIVGGKISEVIGVN